MISTYDIDKLKDFLQSFYNAVGIRISVFDDEFHLVTEYPENAPHFCSFIRQTPCGTNACRECDIAAFKVAKKKGTSHVYICHAGLTEAVAPIKLGGCIMGYVVLAHMLPQENYIEHLKNAFERAEHYGVPKDYILPALKQIVPRTKENIDACVRLLEAVASYLHIADWVTWKNEDFAIRISQYIDLNIDKDLNSDLLCKTFFISRTKLYQIAINSYGKSISKYILFKRIEKAKLLLQEGQSISKTAKKVGFDDANYFSKVFKKETGITASLYQKKSCNHK